VHTVQYENETSDGLEGSLIEVLTRNVPGEPQVSSFRIAVVPAEGRTQQLRALPLRLLRACRAIAIRKKYGGKLPLHSLRSCHLGLVVQ
jgi:hypothetical protein